MSINLTDELNAATKKGKIAAAKQVFLDGDSQTVQKEIEDINARHDSLSSKHDELNATVSEHTTQIANNQSQITANKSAQDAKNASLDANMAKLNTRDDQITELVKGVTATGGASVATAVSYDNASSNLDAATAQGAIDELATKKLNKTDIVQELGDAEDKVVSQKAVSDCINNISSVDGSFLGVKATNLLDVNRAAFNGEYYFIDKGEIKKTDSKIIVSHLIPIKEETKLTISSKDAFGAYLGYRFLDKNYKIIEFGSFEKLNACTLQIPNMASFFQFAYSLEQREVQVEYGETASSYVPYPIVQDPEVLKKLSELSKKDEEQDSSIATKASYEDISTFLDYVFITNIGDINNTQLPNEWVNTSLLKFDKRHDIVFYGDNVNGYINVLAFYDHNKKYISGISNVEDTVQRISSGSIPTNAEYVCVCAKNDKNKLKILHYVPYIEEPIKHKSFLESTDFNNNIIKISDVPNVKFGQAIALYAQVTSFKKVTIYHGRIAYAGGKVEIDDTNIYAYHLDASSKFGEYPHGLEIKDFLSITISQGSTKTAKLIINTLGGMFVQDIPWTGSYGDIECEFEESEVSDVNMTYSNSDFKKDIWAFGDSYFDYLTPKLKELGYNNALFDSYSGRQSAQALDSLKLMFNVFGKPKYIYWAMGMNDADNQDSVNESWKSTYDELVSICKENDITLVFATIPKTPTHNHDFKNHIIKNSGYRYVDNNKAVSKDTNGNWYDDYMENDNTHPKEKGINAIVSRMALEFPELKKEL